MKEKNPVIPARIRQARESRKLSLSDLAVRIDVTKQAISQYETGKVRPSDAILNQLSIVLKYSPDFFRMPMPVSNSAASGAFFRSRKTAAVKDTKSMEAKMGILRQITEYLSLYVEFPKPNLPEEYYDNDPEPLSPDQIEELAIALRKFWGIGNGPISNLMNIVQRNGIIVSSTKFSASKIDGLSELYDQVPYIFMSTAKESSCRIRFGIAHELCHLYLHAGNVPEEEIRNNDIHTKLEAEANMFAGAFLLPKETFSKDVISTSLDYFIQLKAKWRVSIAAMIYRCETLQLLSENQIRYLKDQMTRRGYWRSEPLDSEIPIESPFLFKQALDLLFDGDILTPEEFVYETAIRSEELEEYCCLPPGTLDVKTPSNIVMLRPKTT